MSVLAVTSILLFAGCLAKEDGFGPATERQDSAVEASGAGVPDGRDARDGDRSSHPEAAGDRETDQSLETSLADAADGALDVAGRDRPVDVASPDFPPPDRIADLAPDRPSNQPQGSPCGHGADCRSGFCVAGFCCNMACTGPCVSCASAATGIANGTCAADRQKARQKCGRACQQIVNGPPAVVDKVCNQRGECVISDPPENFEICDDSDPCTSVICDHNSAANTARCVPIRCGPGECCCDGGNAARMCVRSQSCTGQGRACEL